MQYRKTSVYLLMVKLLRWLLSNFLHLQLYRMKYSWSAQVHYAVLRLSVVMVLG